MGGVKLVRRRVLSLTMALSLALSLISGHGAFAKETKTFTDLAGREITLELPVESMVIPGWSGSGNPFFTLFAIMGDDAPNMIIGMGDSLVKFRGWVWEKYIERYPALLDIPNVGRPPEINVEKIIALQPDVVVVPTGAYASGKDAFEILERAGVPIVQIDYHAQSLEKHVQSMRIIGDLVGKPERTEELIEFYKTQSALVYDRLAEADPSKQRIYIENGYDPAEYANTNGNWLWGVLSENAGGSNIARDKFERSGTLSPEFVLSIDPQVVVFTGSNWESRPNSLQLGYEATEEEAKRRLSQFLSRQGWENLSAVEDRKVFGIHQGLAREVWDFYALQVLAKWMHPELFEDLDPLDGFKEFHERFLGVEFSGVWAVELD